MLIHIRSQASCKGRKKNVLSFASMLNDVSHTRFIIDTYSKQTSTSFIIDTYSQTNKYTFLNTKITEFAYLHFVRTEVVYERTEGEPVTPRGRHVGDLDPFVPGSHTLTPLEQVLGGCGMGRGGGRWGG